MINAMTMLLQGQSQNPKKSLGLTFTKVAALKSTKAKSALMTEEEAAQWLNISTPTLRRIRKAGEITFCKLHGCIRYSVEQLQDYVKSVSKKTCQSHASESDLIGLASASVHPHITPLGSMTELVKQSAVALAQATLGKPKES